MLAVRTRQTVRAIIGDRAEFVELVFAEALGAQARHTKTKAGHRQNDQSDENNRLATGEDTATGEEVRSQTGGDNDFSSCGQNSILSAKRARVEIGRASCR